MVGSSHIGLHTATGGSIAGAIIAYAAEWLPVLQVIAAIGAIVSTSISLYYFFKKK